MSGRRVLQLEALAAGLKRVDNQKKIRLLSVVEEPVKKELIRF